MYRVTQNESRSRLVEKKVLALCVLVKQRKVLTVLRTGDTGTVGLAPNWARLAPNGTNPGLFQIRFQYIWLGRAKCTEI